VNEDVAWTVVFGYVKLKNDVGFFTETRPIPLVVVREEFWFQGLNRLDYQFAVQA
jgi:hypothetical protein